MVHLKKHLFTRNLCKKLKSVEVKKWKAKKKGNNEFIQSADNNASGYLHNKSSLLLMQLTTKMNFKLH